MYTVHCQNLSLAVKSGLSMIFDTKLQTNLSVCVLCDGLEEDLVERF